jgi:hypothetical protein
MTTISAILSFLGGSMFRMLWGELSAYFNKKQDHKHEVELLKLQDQISAAQHERNLAAIKIQAGMQVKVIEVAAQGDVDRTLAKAWEAAVEATARSTNIWFVDLWNATIRPLGATWALSMLSANEFGWLSQPLSENTQMVAYAFIGLFVADRTLGKKGK